MDSRSFVHEFVSEYVGMCLVGNSYSVHCADWHPDGDISFMLLDNLLNKAQSIFNDSIFEQYVCVYIYFIKCYF